MYHPYYDTTVGDEWVKDFLLTKKAATFVESTTNYSQSDIQAYTMEVFKNCVLEFIKQQEKQQEDLKQQEKQR